MAELPFCWREGACSPQGWLVALVDRQEQHQWVNLLGQLCWAYARSLPSCSTFCDPIDYSFAIALPGFSGILQARRLEWVAMASSRGSSPPRDRTRTFYICSFGGRVPAPHGAVVLPLPKGAPDCDWGPRQCEGWELALSPEGFPGEGREQGRECGRKEGGAGACRPGVPRWLPRCRLSPKHRDDGRKTGSQRSSGSRSPSPSGGSGWGSPQQNGGSRQRSGAHGGRPVLAQSPLDVRTLGFAEGSRAARAAPSGVGGGAGSHRVAAG